MNYTFEQLPLKDREFLLQVPAYVALLIAGADSEINKAEIDEAISLTQLKKVTSREMLQEYYDQVRPIFPTALAKLIESMPKDGRLREQQLTETLEKVNPILDRLEHKFAVQFYASMKNFAKGVAESSGGVFGYMTVSYEESKLVDLPMIHNPDDKPSS